jgi:enoyl-CoA hydratase/carnithine racemase
MAIVEWKKEETFAIVTMNNGENRHNPDFAKGMLAAYDEIIKDESINAIILTSSDEKSWSQGIDLGWIFPAYSEKNFDVIKKFMYDMNEVFKRNLLLPVPTIAAMNGHTAGNGTILACSCDFRLMKADRGFFFFPEVDLNIPFLPSMLEMMKKSFPYYKLYEAVMTGKRYGAKELEEHHAIVKASDNADALMADALALARTFQKKRPIFGEHKKRFHKHIIAAMEKEDPVYIDSMFLFIQ